MPNSEDCRKFPALLPLISLPALQKTTYVRYSMLIIVVAVCQSTVGHSVLACMTNNFELAFDSGENIGLPWLMTDNGKLAFDSRAFDCAEGASKTAALSEEGSRRADILTSLNVEGTCR